MVMDARERSFVIGFMSASFHNIMSQYSARTTGSGQCHAVAVSANGASDGGKISHTKRA